MKLQLSLRSLLLAITGLCALLSYIAIDVGRARNEQRAVEALSAAGAGITYRPRFGGLLKSDSCPDWVTSLCPATMFCCVTDVSFNYGVADSRALGTIAQLRGVRGIRIEGGPFGDPELSYLVGQQGIEYLKLPGTDITNAAVPRIAQLGALKELDLSFTPITYEGVVQMAPLPSLKRLVLSEDQVCEDGLGKLKEVFPHCDIAVVDAPIPW